MHNAILDKVAKENNLGSMTIEEQKKGFYSLQKIEGFDLPSVSRPAFTWKSANSIVNFVDINFPNLLRIEKEILSASGEMCTRDYNMETGKKFDELLDKLLSSSEISREKKIMLAGSIEVARSSSMYWTDAYVNPDNPYYKILNKKSGLKLTLAIPIFTCSTLIDIMAYGRSYNEYVGQTPYSEESASKVAALDAAYNSALAEQGKIQCIY